MLLKASFNFEPSQRENFKNEHCWLARHISNFEASRCSPVLLESFQLLVGQHAEFGLAPLLLRFKVPFSHLVTFPASSAYLKTVSH